MTDPELDNQQIIEKALHALFSIDELAGKIALHGGQALIAYNISHRASQDIDLYVGENTITERQTNLIKNALIEEFNDSGMEVRKFKIAHLPSRTRPERLTKITASIAGQDFNAKDNMKSPIRSFGGSKGLDIEISLNNNMFHLSTIDSQDVVITVSSLTRIAYEKILSACENSPGYVNAHPGKGNIGRSLRTKDVFDISSILRARADILAQLTSPEGIVFLRKLMDDIGIVKAEVLRFKNDITLYEDRYREEYETVNKTLVPVNERIEFTEATAMMANLLTLILDEM
ncbi:nucleotidyl transferase AbiEii/AbiGii toxin family protein [Bifidobacterium mongoliense]|uniref:nucleotidyl transferase AbiEii/AbiGii toxin family protein n=1 Tax=Bifidobacterium mongoliense TaxID=518643 RepID=UPI0030ECAC40